MARPGFASRTHGLAAETNTRARSSGAEARRPEGPSSRTAAAVGLCGGWPLPGAAGPRCPAWSRDQPPGSASHAESQAPPGRPSLAVTGREGVRLRGRPCSGTAPSAAPELLARLRGDFGQDRQRWDLGRETHFLGREDVGAGGRAVSLASGADPGVLCDQGVRHAAPLGGGTPWARCPCPQGCESCLAGAQQPHQADGTETGVHCKQTAVRDLGQSSLWQAGSGQWPGAGSPAGGLRLSRQVGLLQCRSPQRCFGAQRLRWQLGSCVSSSVRGRGGRELGPGGQG